MRQYQVEVGKDLNSDSTIEPAHVTVAVGDTQFIGRRYSTCAATHETEPMQIH
jgi:hypothetical protein